MSRNDHKIVLIGDTNVGKSSIAAQFVRKKFNEHSEPTIGAAFLTKPVIYNDTQYMLNIWDTAGQEKYNSLIPMYYRNANAAIIIYDTTNEESLFNCNRWINDLKTHCPDIYTILVGNKCDLENRVLKSHVQTFVQKHNIQHLEVSAKTNQNIEQIFNSIIPHLIVNDETAPLIHQMEQLAKHDNNCSC
tara:strand:- start:83 stop:649 length:567 start_codon:yes stop_codon:yes gene_type:complete